MARELKIREARKSLLSFTSYTNEQYEVANHHELIAAKLEAVERGDIDRLMIFMPPRHGKSELASKRFPAWCLGRDPRRQIIAASYNSELAEDFGRNVRNIVDEAEFAEVFPNVSLATDSHSAKRMNTNHGGAYVAAGVGTAVTGRGAHIALIDDPFKDREEADSERRRDLVWDWYRSKMISPDDYSKLRLTSGKSLSCPPSIVTGTLFGPSGMTSLRWSGSGTPSALGNGPRSTSSDLNLTTAHSFSANGSRNGKRCRRSVITGRPITL
jgi:hypothetical protein